MGVAVTSQTANILAHLQSGMTLTPHEAFTLYGSLALHSRIAELRERGFPISCTLIETPSGKRVGCYQFVFDQSGVVDMSQIARRARRAFETGGHQDGGGTGANHCGDK